MLDLNKDLEDFIRKLIKKHKIKVSEEMVYNIGLDHEYFKLLNELEGYFEILKGGIN